MGRIWIKKTAGELFSDGFCNAIDFRILIFALNFLR
jgi:hypothetical protein